MGTDDSDNDEGFVPMKMQIKADVNSKPAKSLIDSKRPVDFHGRYVFGQGIFKKQPPEVYNRFLSFLQNPYEQFKNESVSIREEPLHPFEKYITSNNYILVYSRLKEKNIFNQKNDDFTNNEMDLSNILNTYNKDHYSMLKNYEAQQNEPSQCKQLEFDSRFEGGNLFCAFRNKKQQNQYTLFLQNDTNSNGYNQWFYFSIRNTEPGTLYKFKIVNLRKKFSFFKENMKLAVFSKKDAQKYGGNGWRKCGSSIKYEKSEIRKQSDKKYKFYMLSFSLVFQHQNDCVSVAMNPPYTYSRLIHNIKVCEQLADKNDSLIWRREAVAHTLANNAVPYLTITNKETDAFEKYCNSNIKTRNQQNPPQVKNNKKAIIFLARQHPGQTWSSYLMEQILFFLAENCQDPKVSDLLDKYVFKVFPMVNIDGVIYGNFRCDLAGFDLNRNWKNPDRLLHPQVYGIKEEIEKISEEYEVACVFDLHGHSKQQNIFCYSCKNDNVTCRILPYLISKAHPYFHFPYCTFGISKYKETTARAVIYSIINNENVLTIQNSFFGARTEKGLIEFSPQSFKEVAAGLFKGLYQFLQDNEARVSSIVDIKANLKQFLGYEKKNNQNDSGSDTDPGGDQINLKERIKKILPKALESALAERLLAEEPKIKKKLKQKKMLKKADIDPKKYDTMEPKINKNSSKFREDQSSQEQTFVQRTSLTQYRRKTKEGNFSIQGKGTINQVLSQETNRRSDEPEIVIKGPQIMKKTQETSLPFYLRDKPRLVPIKLKNDSLEMFKSAYEYQSANKQKRQRQELSSMASGTRANSFKATSNRIIKVSKKQQVKEQFPLLCVLSENKKKSQIQRLHGSPIPQETIQLKDRRQQTKVFRTYVKNEKLERIRKSQKQKEKQKQRNNATLISKVWRENIARYGKNLNVFTGDIMRGL